ncbi:probable C-mannosyltransferase DPY19L3 [Xenia sp. Carnegie-2017]|uniref:probable C-mannosyltransferase DPY19L3 n=1 Tax=Xenia sp. Carnegie-2017 TaxID=2897299 RepID=UPI001F0492EA|nr:probable C-mannosyltransferase DPY19L3 [Xenia sp. Carnegie-2017]XP_046864718.1 probable C-mannosyltransferase DPY19L3 [Xenia sp. Carnegie-2017]XP_046864719.1 probable C-mannosyltransferase DPY19L3 [Xenia sp. Carnegie-2017]XP_046864720.1 probable C-mannosyltransferase DPY19L3 [Xenia sp. Carnegie-2017]
MLYLCKMSFRMLPVDTYWRLTEDVVFPCYVFAVVFGFTLLAVCVLEEWSGNDFISWWKNVHTSLKRRPEVVYHLVQTFFFTFMAVTTLRFKFLWMPHICIVAAGIICLQDLWSFLLSKIYLTCAKAKIGSSLVPIILIVLVLCQSRFGFGNYEGRRAL